MADGCEASCGVCKQFPCACGPPRNGIGVLTSTGSRVVERGPGLHELFCDRDRACSQSVPALVLLLLAIFIAWGRLGTGDF